jgi:hypothetical protein
LVVLGVVFVVGVIINTNLGLNSAINNSVTAQAIVANVNDSYANASSLLPILGIVVIAGVVLYILRSTFMGGPVGSA